ncbi:hypothetical protein POM88_001721 [Heracleum sosnowskyi]|uniref:Uncharacterized protein n=1 Tax=Heracleum sosnowskyi TaxID=360622 RepID=A0AAD8JGE7_9APIA|nr:hypothetical protein POM88_001721 [Heracleum sosnowskyi]
MHCLVRCNFAQACICEAGFGNTLDSSEDFEGWLNVTLSSYSRLEAAELVMSLWSIWKARNMVVWHGTYLHIDEPMLATEAAGSLLPGSDIYVLLKDFCNRFSLQNLWIPGPLVYAFKSIPVFCPLPMENIGMLHPFNPLHTDGLEIRRYTTNNFLDISPTLIVNADDVSDTWPSNVRYQLV